MSSPRSSGFTLLELVVVIAVIAILASVVAPAVLRNVTDAKIATTRTQLEILSTALDAYRLDNDAYPSTAQGLEALVQRPAGDPPALNWRGPYLRRGLPNDPWRSPYRFVSPAPTPIGYQLYSLGRDGRPGGRGPDADISIDSALVP